MTAYAQLTLLPEREHAPVLAKIRAINKVESNADPAWLAKAYGLLRDLCASQLYLTSDDLWLALDGAGVPVPHEPRALGAVMRQAARDGLIESTGTYVPSEREACHARPVQKWRVVK